MSKFLTEFGTLKASLLIAAALMLIAVLIMQTNDLLSDAGRAHEAELREQKAAADKAKKIMTYDPSKARLVAP